MSFSMLISLEDMKGHLGLTSDQTEDDVLIKQKLVAAQRLIQRQLGYDFADRFAAAEDVPPDLLEAIMQLAAWWFENRDTVIERSNVMPFGVPDIIAANRDWSF